MGLFGMMARTAVIAGTATAVSNRVSRRQQRRWQQKSDAQANQDQADQTAPEDQQQPAPQDQQPQYQQPVQYQQPPPQYQQPQYQQPPAEPAAAEGDVIAQLQKLAALKTQGVLTDEEFSAAKAKVLGS